MKINLPKQVEIVINILESFNHQAYIVGGCVRDSYLNKIPNDWDICTSATPNKIIEYFKDYKVIETGLKHGTVTLIIDNASIEITTFRIEGEYVDNRKPSQVLFTNNLKLDLERRDFTINALVYNPKTGIIDFFNGLNDIKNKIIKTVGNPNERFEEDALRILRCIRFSSTLSFSIDIDTVNALNQNKYLLNNISKERIRDEFNKLILGDNCFEVLKTHYNIIEIFIPEIKNMIGFEQHNKYHIYDVYTHTLVALKNSQKNLIIRLSLFCHDIGKPEVFSIDSNGVGHFYNHSQVSQKISITVLKRLKYDNKTINYVSNLVKYHDLVLSDNIFKIKKILYNKMDLETFKLLLEVKKCDDLGKNLDLSNSNIETIKKVEKIIDFIIENNHCINLNQLEINGNDLKHLGICDGVKIGEILNKLMYEVLLDNNKNYKDLLINKVKIRLK